MKKISKVPIRILKELPGCLINRIQFAMRREAYCLWADGVANAEDIEKGIKATIGFRMPHEGPMMHNVLSGIWRWPLLRRHILATPNIAAVFPLDFAQICLETALR